MLAFLNIYKESLLSAPLKKIRDNTKKKAPEKGLSLLFVVW
jgi:hypothetical protein